MFSLFFCLVNDFSTTRGPIQAKCCIRAYSGSGCVFSPFGGWRPPSGGKSGKWNFRYYMSQWEILAFWWFLSDISPTRARIQTIFHVYRNNVCRRASPPLGSIGPWGAGGRGVKNSKMWVSVTFLDVWLSQGSVATYCGWGRNLCDVYMGNFLTNHLVKEFWKLVHICQSYYQTSRGLVYFGTRWPGLISVLCWRLL